MDNNINSNPAAVEQPADIHADTGGNGGQGKLFTQEDVNRIVSERLAREREKAALQQPAENTQDKEMSEREAALIEREKAVEAKESRARCIEYLKEKNINEKRFDMFLDNLDTGNVDAFKKAVDIFGEPYVVKTITTGSVVDHPPMNTGAAAELSSIFKPKILK